MIKLISAAKSIESERSIPDTPPVLWNRVFLPPSIEQANQWRMRFTTNCEVCRYTLIAAIMISPTATIIDASDRPSMRSRSFIRAARRFRFGNIIGVCSRGRIRVFGSWMIYRRVRSGIITSTNEERRRANI